MRAIGIGGWVLVLALSLAAQEKSRASSAESVDNLVKQLGSDDVAARELATNQLIEMGKDVLPFLKKHRNSKDLEVRARLAGIRLHLSMSRMAEVFSFVEKARKEGRKVEEWKPELKTLLVKFLEVLGEDASPESRRDTARLLPRIMERPLGVVRENRDKARKGIYVLNQAKGDKFDDGLLLCASADYGEIDDSIVICLGDVKIRELKQSLVFAMGKVEVIGKYKDAYATKNSIILCGGGFLCTETALDNTIISPKGVKIVGRSKENAFINSPAVMVGSTFKDRTATKKSLPGSPPK